MILRSTETSPYKAVSLNAVPLCAWRLHEQRPIINNRSVSETRDDPEPSINCNFPDREVMHHQINLRSLFSPIFQTSDEIKWIREYIPHRSNVWSQQINGQKVKSAVYTYCAPVIILREAVICQGRYPLDRIGNLWIGGVSYYQRGIELNGIVGEVAVNKESLAILTREARTTSVTSYKNAILIGGRDNFGHFLFELLPKIFLASMYLDHSWLFLLSSALPARFLEFVRLLGVADDRIKIFEEGSTFKVEMLVLPGVSAHRHPTKSVPCIDTLNFVGMINFLKGAAGLNLAKNFDNLNLYVPRNQERWRRIINEQHLINELGNEKRLEVIDPKELSAKDQILLFGSVSSVVMPLGGASPSVMFCSTRTRIIEISTPIIDGLWGRTFCGLFDLDYYRIDGHYSDDGINKGVLPIDKDFTVDPSEILRIFRR